MKTIDKIIQSDVAPKRKDVVWFDTTTGELKMFGTSGWNTVSGGGDSTELIITIDSTDQQDITVTMSDESFVGACFATMNIVVSGQIMQSASGTCTVAENSMGIGNYDKVCTLTIGSAMYQFKHNKYSGVWEFGAGDVFKVAAINDDQSSYDTTYSSKKILTLISGGGGGTSPLVETTWSELKTSRDADELVPGQQYRITNFTTTSARYDTQSAEHPFDIIVTADSSSTLNEVARAINHSGDSYFSDCNLAAWELKYCLDNDDIRFTWAKKGRNGFNAVQGSVYIQEAHETIYFPAMRYPEGDADGKYAWAVASGSSIENADWDSVNTSDLLMTSSETPAIESTGTVMGMTATIRDFQTVDPIVPGTGIIYYMKDEYNNECCYDFKNILFYREDNDSWNYTFGKSFDDSLTGNSYNNSIKSYRTTTVEDIQTIELNNIIFGVYAHDNVFGNDCYQNTFGENVSFNTIGNDFNNNTTSDYFINNKIGNRVINNTFLDASANIIEDDVMSNTFGSQFDGNVVGYHSSGNTFESQFFGNTIGQYCEENEFSVKYINYCTFGANVRDCIISGYYTNASNRFQNITVLAGTSGTYSQKLALSGLTLNAKYTQICGFDSSNNYTHKAIMA